MRLGLAHADIVKIGEEEIAFLVGDACDVVEGARALWHPRLRVMAVTRGAGGSLWLDPAREEKQPGFKVAWVDTTGAGDAFMAGLLVELVDPARTDDPGALGEIVRFANAAGALSTTEQGAMPSLPDRPTVERFLAERGGNAARQA